jgi:hypothetical protein
LPLTDSSTHLDIQILYPSGKERVALASTSDRRIQRIEEIA